MANPLPSSPKVNIVTRQAGERRRAEIEEKAWQGRRLFLSSRQIASELGCSHTTVLAAWHRRSAELKEDMPATREAEVLETIADIDRLLRKLQGPIDRGDLGAFREARHLLRFRAEMRDLFPDQRLEVSGAITTFAQVPMEDRIDVLRQLQVETARRLKALTVEGREVKPKALPAAKKCSPRKRTAKPTKHAPKSVAGPTPAKSG
jgi:hypothetical protein